MDSLKLVVCVQQPEQCGMETNRGKMLNNETKNGQIDV